MSTYAPTSLGIQPPKTGFQEGGWYSGRQYWGGTLSDVGTIHPLSNQIGAGQAVSNEVNAQSAAAQGVSVPQFDAYLSGQRLKQQQIQNSGGGASLGTAGAGSGFAMPDTVPASNGGGGGGAGFMAPTTLNLQSVYDKAYQESGIMALQDEFNQKNKALIEQSSLINENPYYSEATRVGRIAKLEEVANKDLTRIQNEIAQKKADVDTKLGLATKQFDINQSASNQALNQFNSLLAAGALDNASGGDLAQFSAATGLPASFIQSAVKLSQQKNVESKLIEATDDYGNVTVSLVQIKDGQMTVVGKQSLGKIAGSKSTGTSQANIKMDGISKASQILDALKNPYGHVSPADWQTVRSAALQSGLTAQEFNNNFASYTDPNRGDFSSSYGFDLKSRGASQYQILGQD